MSNRLAESLYPAMRQRMALDLGDRLIFEGGIEIEIVGITQDITGLLHYAMREAGEGSGVMSWQQDDIDFLLTPPPAIRRKSLDAPNVE